MVTHRFDDGMDAALTRRLRTGAPAALTCVLALVPAHASRAAEWALCAPPTVPPPPPADLESSTLQGDSATLRGGGVSVVEGNVILRTPERTITSHRMEYDPATGRAEASGEVTVRERDVFLEGSRLHADLDTGETVLEEARYRHPASHGRGEAARIENRPGTTVFTDGSFTTCDPGSNVWKLKANELEIDHESEIGIARHARLSIFEVPVLYTPWISFPTGDQRTTGFLTPSFETSDNAGSSLTLPYYLNLAPSYDATLRPRLTSRRGPVLGGQFRFLTEGGAGTLEAEALPEDRITGDSRSIVSFAQRQRLAPGFDARVQYARASDIDYLRDLGVGAPVANTDHLRRFAGLAYNAAPVRFRAEVEDFQILKDSPGRSDPYRAVPRLALETRSPERNQRLDIDFRGELVRFDHRTNLVAEGTRVDLRPSAVIPLHSSYGYLRPRATLNVTGYDLSEAAGHVPDSLARLVPSFSVDGGLYFDHQTMVGGRRFTQTLEPRLFYVRVPYRDQDRLPLFDAGSFTFGYDHMFRENRFSGRDRIGDAERLTLALDTRLLGGGREVFGARLGTMHHFRDRRVRLCTSADPVPGSAHCEPLEGAEADDPRPSTWVAAAKARPHRSFTIGGAIEDDGGLSRHRAVSLDLRYHPSPERILNLGYRRYPVKTASASLVQESVDDVTESVTLSAHRDLGANLRLLGSASYALEEDTMTEVYAGLDYDSCCWRVRLVWQRYLPGGSTEHERSVMLELKLKGLTGAGFGGESDRSRIRPIPGYRNPF